MHTVLCLLISYFWQGLLYFLKFYLIKLGIVLPRWHSGKESTSQCRRCRFNPWVGKIPWKRKWQPVSVFLPAKSHGQRNLVGYSSMGSQRVGHDLVTEQQQSTYLIFTMTLWCGKLIIIPCGSQSPYASMRKWPWNTAVYKKWNIKMDNMFPLFKKKIKGERKKRI